MTDLIVAHTKLDPAYPGYINITRQDDGRVVVIVRGDPISPANHPEPGEYAQLSLSAKEWEAVARAIVTAK